MNNIDHLLNIKNFWNNQALKYGENPLATMPDLIAFELESEQMLKIIPDGTKVIDIGCGNGVKGITLTQHKNCNYVGVDYSEEMIKQAQNLLSKSQGKLRGDTSFEIGNVLENNFVSSRDFDIAMSFRCLINLGAFENQVLAVKNIWSVIKDGGTYLMFENSIQSLHKINDVRNSFGLPDIQVRWHNLYIDEDRFFDIINRYFRLIEVVNYVSTYFLISRTLNVLLCSDKDEIDYLSDLNKLAAKLPALGDFCPQKLFILKKVL